MTTDERVLVLMPTAKDSERTCKALAGAGLQSTVCTDLATLCFQIQQGAGAALLTEEMILGDRQGLLQQALGDQPSWSDFPLVVLAREGSDAAELRESTNATLVERPVRLRSLLSVVRSALRSRRHQYAIRHHLAEHVRQTEVVRKGEERLRRMINVDAVGVLVFALPDGRLTDANEYFLRKFGYSRAEIDAGLLTWRTMTPPEYVAISAAQIEGFARTGRIGPYEKEYLRKDGSRAWMVFAGAALGDGTVVEYCIDIGDRKRAEEALRDADRRKDEFLATLAHELRNPLAPIRNGLEIMRLLSDNPAEVEQSRAMIERQVNQMVRLVDDLLDVSRISRGKITLQKLQVELAAVIKQAVETSRPLVESARHSLTITTPPDPIYVDADLTRLAQVFSNLLNNAAKYTETGGRIHILIERAGEEAVITVKDTGVGIPTRMLPKVFDMFTQVDQNLERIKGGLGIGLSIVKQLVEMHEGSVHVESAGPGKGSEFTVRLPVAKTIERLHDPHSAATPTSSGKRILVEVDNVDAAVSLAKMLELMGNETKTAHDGLRALDVAEEYRPNVILLDIGMPVLNGYETARRIRQRTWGDGVKLVALTGWGQEEDRRRSADAGFDSHMVKPVDILALKELLAGVGARPV